MTDAARRQLFTASFVALVATAFAFMLRVLLMDEWAAEFSMSETEKGQVFGAGFWPFGVSIVVFSLFIDRVGYRAAFLFAFVCHVGFAVMTILAKDYQMLYWGSVIGALGNGAIEAAINPLIATVYSKEKTKWLNILHAGWPGGLVVTGIVLLSLGSLFPVDANGDGGVDWRIKIGLILLPTLAYGFMILRMNFPVSERVAAGVTDRESAREMGWAGAFIVAFMIVSELFNTFGVESIIAKWVTIAVLTAGAFVYLRSFGRPLFVFLLLVMLLLATTELGTDSWIKSLMEPVVKKEWGMDGGWILVYTAFLMMMLRLFCGPIVERVSPLGILALSSIFAAVGIFLLGSVETGIVVLVAATIYGIGQTFFWPTTLGLVSEQFPKGGAITINVIAGVGMLGVGILGNPWLGNLQDTDVGQVLKKEHPQIHSLYVTDAKKSIFGDYIAVNDKKLKDAPKDHQEIVTSVRKTAKKNALRTAAVLPLIMLACYVSLMAYFRTKGGYRPVEIGEETAG